MSDIPPSKAQLRSLLRRRRQAIPFCAQQSAAQALTQSVVELPRWTSAQRIAVYIAADGEIGTDNLTAIAKAAGKQLFLPMISTDQSVDFAHWDADAVLSVNRYNIPEPPAGSLVCPTSDLDIIFLPLVGWDLRGGRLGMGGGFYDRTLAASKGPLLVGLAHGCQQVAAVPRDNWDVQLHYVATDVALYRCENT